MSHLWFVISGPTLANRVVIVNVSSDDGGYADLPVLARADHPWLKHDSFIRTDEIPNPFRLAVLRDKLAKGVFVSKEPLTSAVLAKVQKAVHASQHTPNEICLILEDQGFI